jgi:2-dehydro-3-deoxygluconokinase
MSASVVTVGELLLRLSPPGRRRLVQAERFDAHYGGAEANVAVALARLGLESRYVTKVPETPLGEAGINFLRRYGVDTGRVVRGGERLGLYFLERGASQRPSRVIYDRAGAAITTLDPKAVDWDAALGGSAWLHWSGITPALGERPRACVEAACRAARAAGATVSCDLNYRSKLWAPPAARRAMRPLMAGVDVCIAGFGSADACLDVQVEERAGESRLERAERLARRLREAFGFEAVATTLRGATRAAAQTYRGALLDAPGAFHASTRYEMEVVDRVGGGDAFAAGLIAGLLQRDDPAAALAFATAAGCLKHTVPGDAGLATREEVEALADGPGRVGQVDR